VAYKNRADQQRAWREWYYRNRSDVVARTAKRRKRRRAEIADYKAQLKCKRCGEDDPACLDLHHRDARSKDITVANAIKHGWSDAKLKAEIEKCDVLCSNCHRKLHAAMSSKGKTAGFDPANEGSNPSVASSFHPEAQQESAGVS
jgi:hypothetical protein